MSKLPSDFLQKLTIEAYWKHVSKVNECDSAGEHVCKYPTLTTLAKSVLIVPHGNVDKVRLFSLMGLNKTNLTNCLGVETPT